MINKVDISPVSVIIPCYSCALTIRRAIVSIVRQSVLPYEVILIDDASDDGTLQVLQELESEHKGWIKLISLPVNAGAASARNSGWDAATQPYIAFLDADDSWHPEKLRIQYEYMKENPHITLTGHLCIDALVKSPIRLNIFVTIRKRMHIMDSKPSS